MNLWKKNPTEQDIEKNLEIVRKGKGELTLPLALLNGEFKKRYKEEVGEFEKMTEEEQKAHRKELNKKYRKTDKYKARQREYMKEYKETDKYKAYRKRYMKEYSKTDKYKAGRVEYHHRPEVKARIREYERSLEYTAKRKAYRHRPEVKARIREYYARNKEYLSALHKKYYQKRKMLKQIE